MTPKEEIINILGENSLDPVQFNYNKETNLETSALYTYEGDVFCLHNGSDFPFDDITTKGQVDILNAIKLNQYIVNPSFQI